MAGLICLVVMIFIDYLLGAEAEHLNAWYILNKLFGREIGIGDSLAIIKFGLLGATVLMLFANLFFGAVLLQLWKLIDFFSTLK